ncbi:hypothetical protein KUTeg_001753, partial [Tegillarca granosa]
KRKKIKNYVENVVPRYTLNTFKTFFRVSKTTFEKVLENVTILPEFEHRYRTSARPKVPVKKDLLMHIWSMVSQETVRSISDRFKTFIKWPTNEAYHRISQEFECKKSFPGIIGAIVATHTRIKAPVEYEADYLN